MLDIKYSIITPVYNREDCIARCVESVIQQSKNIHYEHIIVNDGSSDHTLDIIQDYSHRYDPYIRVINSLKTEVLMLLAMQPFNPCRENMVSY